MGRHLILTLAAGLILSACTIAEPPEQEAPGIVRIEVPSDAESMSPNLAVGPDGTVVLSWLESSDPDHLLNYSELRGGSWGPARTIARSDNWFINWADFPSVVPISEKLWAAHWLDSQAEAWYAYNAVVALSTDAGQTWSEPINPHLDGTDTEHGFVTLYPDGAGVGLVWLDGRNMVNEVTDDVAASGMTLRGASLSPDLVISNEQLVDELICDCCQTDVAITNDGPVAIYRNRTSDEIRDIYATRHDGKRWQEGKAVANDNWNIPGCPVNGPAIDADRNTVVIAWFTAANDVSRVQVVFSDDAAESFSAPIDVVSDDTIGRIALAMLPDGDVAVSWLRKASIDSAELCVRRVSADGKLGPIKVVSVGDDVPRFSFPRMVAKGQNLILAWTRRFEDSSHIITAKVSIDIL